jgi:hypothetical protein
VIYRTWTATDDCGNSTARTQTITVTDYTAPVLAGIPADITIQCDEPLPAPATPTATDNCDQNVTISYNQTVQTIGCTNIYTRTWTATDDCGNSTARSQTITTIDTEAPVITFINPALIGAENGDTLYFDCVYGPNLGINDITITDNCDDNPTGTFLEGTITQGDCIEDGYIVEMHCGWSVTDNCGNSTQLWVVIRVTDSIPPVISAPPADITLHCYESIPPVATLTATDLCDDNVTVTFNQTSPTSGCTPTLIRTWTATDDCGNTDVATQTIIFIDDSAPVLVGVPANITVECNEVPPPAVVTATDDCDQNVAVTFTETQQAQPCGYLLIRRWTATDDCGNAKTGTQVITVTDETAPVIAGVPADVTVECTAVPAVAQPTATDNCDLTPTLTYNQTAGPQNACTQVIYRTWTATDDCGNSTARTQTITVTDYTAPVITGVPANVTVECDEVPAPAQPVATDNCDQSPTLAYNQVISQNGCTQTIVRTWTATDDCGNSTARTQTITTNDTTDPVLTGVPADLTLECGTNPPAPATPGATQLRS